MGTKINYFLEHLNDEVKSVHVVSRPKSSIEYPKVKDEYRQSLSYDAFKNNEGKRVLRYGNTPDVKFYFEYTLKEYEKEKPYIGNVDIYEHQSIWDFYTFIGYDYKTKKYLLENQNAK